jgi:hypothetical protein
MNTMLQSAGNPRFSSDVIYQTPIILDLGTKKSVIPTVQAFQDHTYFPKVLRLGKTHTVDIIGIGNVGGLSNVLQSADGNQPALLSASNYLEAWPNSIITLDANQATIYESPYKPTELTSSQIQQSLPNWKIIAIFQQVNNIYIASNYMFLYNRQTISSESVTSPSIHILDQEIHIGMMEALPDEVDVFDAILMAASTLEQQPLTVSQIVETSTNYIFLTNKDGIEVNLVENEQKDILLAPAIDEDAPKEAAHDSGASSTLIGFHDVYSDYKKQIIPIRTAGNTIYAAGIGSVGVLQNVIHVPNLQKQLLSISRICNQLNYAYLINCTKLEVINNVNQEVVHTCYRNNGLYTTRDLSWLGIDLSRSQNSTDLNLIRASKIYSYIAGVSKEALIVQTELIQSEQNKALTKEEFQIITSAFLTKSDAVYKLHATLGHLPYSRI